MTDAFRYPVPATRCRAELVVDRSRFICSLSRAVAPDEAQAFVRDIQSEFPGATHHCWAYVAGAPNSTLRIGMSDDGEPHGTAGRPMLTVLLHSGVGEIAAVVTRFYGGTKLGTGGLARAYSGAVQAALRALETRERVEFVLLAVVVTYPQVSAVLHLLPRFEATLASERFDEAVTFGLQAPRAHRTALRAAIANATQGSAIFLDDPLDDS